MAVADPKKAKKKCPDCLECQMCSRNRCEICKAGGHKDCESELGPFITHGEYMKWKRKNGKEGVRGVKRKVHEILELTDFDAKLAKLYEIPSSKVINALFSFLQSTDEAVKWAAVGAMGSVVAEIAVEDMETARVIMRRLMWNLNDESGGIGWGSPEAMGEILACHEGLADEYAHILLSYAKKDGNYLEHEMLQSGLLWGIGRLSQVRPHLVKDAAHCLIPYLEAKDAQVRGLAVWVLGQLDVEEARNCLERLTNDSSEVQIYTDRRFKKFRLKDLVVEVSRKEVL